MKCEYCFRMASVVLPIKQGQFQAATLWNPASVLGCDIGGQERSYAEVKAIASGNPAVLTLAEADAELQRLTLLKKNHLDEHYFVRRNVRDLPRNNRSSI